MLIWEKPQNLTKLPPHPLRKGEGGLRTKGYHKTSCQSKPLLSIITVVLNDEDYLEKTIQSVINQTYSNGEYIIIDGGSTDATLDIIKKYEDYIDYWVSEPDEGISDAFNKGLNLCAGRWVYFLNSGDTFFSERTLEKCVLMMSNCDVITGSVKIMNTKKFFPRRPVRAFYKGFPAHQGTIIRARIAKSVKFDKNLKIRMDYDYFLKLNKKHPELRVYKFGDFVANYRQGGISSTKIISFQLEGIKVALKNFRWYPLTYLIKGIIKVCSRIISKI